MNPDSIPGDVWDEYGSLQQRAEQVVTVAHRAWAIEDQLNSFLDSLSKGSLPADREVRERQLNNLKVNRQKKHLHRFRLLQCFAQTDGSVATNAFDEVLQEEQLARVRSLTTPDEWEVLWKLAREQDYETIAGQKGLTVSALKTRVSRCRYRLRNDLAA